ncbi:MAG: histidine--tRNA ligase [Alphaproteobacteria bacterium]|nr:histidine--tRNA ligase [Alphaproteobacteria bacterium]
MGEKKKIYKPKAISGFPEWLPEERLVEQKWLDHIRQVFESYGFCSIETPSVEELDVITAKGEVDKEIYVLERLHKDEDSDKEARLALHFDQTVPLARYTAQHFNDLVFPFKRYQMQRVWRGERPQMGRMREFTQCDIDVINVDNLPLSFDAEMPSIVYEALEGLNIGRVQLRISNRKILMGLLQSLGIEDPTPVTRIIDKIEKLHEGQIEQLLKEEGLNTDQISKILNLAKTKELSTLSPENDLMKKGIEELQFVMDNLSHLPDHAVVADLSIVRGLDYYTGTVYETQLLDVPEFTGSVCSGGRYDDLAGSYINKHLPGVGISIGFSRLFDVIRQSRRDLLDIGPKCPADILMVLPSAEQRETATQTARSLRKRGFKVEMYHAPQKVKKQLSYAEKKGIPFVWFPPFEGGQEHEIKNMNSGEQTQADPNTWEKP